MPSHDLATRLVPSCPCPELCLFRDCTTLQGTVRDWEDGYILHCNAAESRHSNEGDTNVGALPNQRAGISNTEGKGGDDKVTSLVGV